MDAMAAASISPGSNNLPSFLIRLSVNINKLATLRNARGGDNPNIIQAAVDIQRFGADGISVHPRPDERHIRYADVRALRAVVDTEFNIEGNPREDKFVQLVLETRPEQVTLVPDAAGQLTSNHGWNTIVHQDYLKDMVQVFRKHQIRVSLFVDPVEEMVEAARNTGTDRIEFYTESYARYYAEGKKEEAITPYARAAQKALTLGLKLNAGHDLDLKNLNFFARSIPQLSEVSIGHALVCDALYYGLENTVQLYKRQLLPE